MDNAVNGHVNARLRVMVCIGEAQRGQGCPYRSRALQSQCSRRRTQLRKRFNGGQRGYGSGGSAWKLACLHCLMLSASPRVLLFNVESPSRACRSA